MGGNNPFWDDDTNSLYYVDLYGGELLRYSYDDDKVYRAVVDKTKYNGYIIPIKGRKNRFLVALDQTTFVVFWDGYSTTATKEEEVFSVNADIKANNLVVGPNDELFASGFTAKFCKPDQPANLPLFAYDPQDKQTSTTTTNNQALTGLVFNEKKNILYNLDGCLKTIYSYDYDTQSRQLCEDECIF